jgi:hypothetical protein
MSNAPDVRVRLVLHLSYGRSGILDGGVRVEVEELVSECEASGFRRDAFCQQPDLSVATLDKYRQRVQKWARGRADPMGSRVTARANTSSRVEAFLRSKSTRSVYRLELPHLLCAHGPRC